MITTEHFIQFNFNAHYFTLGDLSPDTRKIWFVLHGYGQLAKYFIRKFQPLADAGIFIIAPEGLSRFYLEDVTSRSQSGNQKVGATWMTRENRLQDISNYINYLNTIHYKIIPPHFDGEITVFGFSQGAATAARWITNHPIKFQRLIAWCGIFPPDMDFALASEILKDKKVVEVIGKSDPYLTVEKMKEMIALNERLKISPEVIKFEGGHEIVPSELIKLIV